MAAVNQGNQPLGVTRTSRAFIQNQPAYAPITESYLQKTGLRGRKGMFFYGLVVFLFVVALANLGVTVLLLTVLRIGYGMESMEFIRPGRLLRFLNEADLGIVVAHTGTIGGFAGENMVITGDSQSVILKAGSDDPLKAGPTIEVSPEFTVISNVDEFRVRSPTTGENIFSTKYDDFKLPSGVPNLSVKEAYVSRISSPSNENLDISSPYQTILKGNEGLSMEGKEIIISAGLDVFFKSVNQSIILDGAKGVKLSVDKMPIATKNNEGAPRWYKLCICMPSGKIFRVPVRDKGYGCKDIRFPESINPCS